MHQIQWNQIAEDVNFNLEIDIARFRNEVSTEQKVLDFGCGYGRIGSILRAAGYKDLVGIDSSASMIDRGKREFPELALELVTGATLPFHDQSFDAVVACAVFTCITDHKIRLSQMNELCRILKPDGLLHLVEFCSEPSKFFTASIGVPMLHSSVQELRELASTLQVVSEEVIKTNTMGGNAANSYRVFAKKSLNKASSID
ncbi:MAG: class I SAM-dependent methyltransferase [Psychrosphaera sp.]|nr:class I SAM-dependent methyltransferase [Psychrosphaera sp.]